MLQTSPPLEKHIGPTQAFAKRVFTEKYCLSGEHFRDVMNRVAGETTDSPEHFHAFRETIMSQRFLTGGRVTATVGSTRRTTPLNCYVSGTVEDNSTGKDGIMQRAVECFQTTRMGGGLGLDFSKLRPRGTMIRSLQTPASGPVSMMPIFNSIGLAVCSAGHRRGALMAVLRVDHPDIEEYIHAKQNTSDLTCFNTSIGITDEFMRAVKNNTDFDLRWNGVLLRTVPARKLWDQIMRSTWDWGEPGVLFLDTINKMNNLWYCEEIAAVNPCGEQPLPPYGACLLGSFNLPKYIVRNRDTGERSFYILQFMEDIKVAVRAMDNIIEIAAFPLIKQELEAKNKRRMGLGITGLANALEACGDPYGSEDFLKAAEVILTILRDTAYLASTELAKEKGSFPLYNQDKYLSGKFIRTLPSEVRAAIKEHGIRNSHLISIAPAGTISLTADNVSSGIEPVFNYITTRDINGADGMYQEIVEDYGYRVFGVEGKLSSECTVEDHLSVFLTASKYTDSAVSKTCNVSPDMPWEDFKNIYMQAWEGGAKGCTTFNPGGKRMGILSETLACEINPDGTRSCDS